MFYQESLKAVIADQDLPGWLFLAIEGWLPFPQIICEYRYDAKPTGRPFVGKPEPAQRGADYYAHYY